MEKIGFIYLWFDRKRKMYYIGCHWGNVDDGYICSSKRMRDAYRYRPEDFKRRIIQTNIQRKNLLMEEYKWLSLIDSKLLGIKYYNHSNRHFGHWSHTDNRQAVIDKKQNYIVSEETKEKISKALLGKKLSESHKKKIGEYQLGRKKPPFSEEHKEKIRYAKLGKTTGPRSEEQKKNISLGNLGKKRTEEAKQRMSLSHMGIKRGPHSEEHKHNMSIARKKHLAMHPHNKTGTHHSEETKQKIRQAQVGKKRRPLTEEHKEKIRNSCILAKRKTITT